MALTERRPPTEETPRAPQSAFDGNIAKSFRRCRSRQHKIEFSDSSEGTTTVSRFNINTIRSARVRFGEAPRKFGGWKKGYLSIPKPLFVGKSEENLIFRHWNQLVTEGYVVWGAINTYDEGLEKNGTEDGRASVCYCPSYHRHDDLNRLLQANKRISDIFGSTPNGLSAEENEIHDLLHNARRWFVKVPLKESVVGYDSLFLSRVKVFRKHLVKGMIRANNFPLIIHPELDTAMILPETFWPEDYVSYWEQDNWH